MARKDKKKSRREMYGRNTQRRVKESHEKNVLGGGGLFKDSIEGVKYWKQKEGGNIIDIIQYFAGRYDPDKYVKEGVDTYKLQVYAHGGVGPDENWLFCRWKNLKKKCPVCEHRQKLQKEGSTDEELIKQLTVSRYPRVIYNVISYNSRDEEEKGVQIWHTSTWNMERHLAELALNPRVHEKGVEAYTDFSHPDQDVGKSISFNSSGSGMSIAFIGHKFVDRDYDISDELLDSAFILDECIFIPTYEQAHELYWGGEEDEQEVVEVTRGRGRGVDVSDEIEKEKTESEEIKEKDEREETETRSTRSRKRKTKEEEVEQDNGEEEDDEMKCPGGGTFGADIDELSACEEECGLWENCAQEADRLEQEKEKKKEKEEPTSRRRRR